MSLRSTDLGVGATAPVFCVATAGGTLTFRCCGMTAVATLVEPRPAALARIHGRDHPASSWELRGNSLSDNGRNAVLHDAPQAVDNAAVHVLDLVNVQHTAMSTDHRADRLGMGTAADESHLSRV